MNVYLKNGQGIPGWGILKDTVLEEAKKMPLPSKCWGEKAPLQRVYSHLLHEPQPWAPDKESQCTEGCFDPVELVTVKNEELSRIPKESLLQSQKKSKAISKGEKRLWEL